MKMLEVCPRQDATFNVHRLANLAFIADFALKKGLTSEQIAEVVDLMGASLVASLLDNPFEPKPFLPQPPFGSSRYSDGKWPVFYAATDHVTAQAEVTHHYAKWARVGDHPVHYSIFQCTFAGTTVDLVKRLEEWPLLISDEYSFCQALGKEASDTLLDAFIAPSARLNSGVAIPIFQRGAISNPSIAGVIRLSKSEDTGHPEASTVAKTSNTT